MKRNIRVSHQSLPTYPSPLSLQKIDLGNRERFTSQSYIPCKIFCISIMYLLSFILFWFVIVSTENFVVVFCFALLLIILLSLGFSISCVRVNTPQENVNSWLFKIVYLRKKAYIWDLTLIRYCVLGGRQWLLIWAFVFYVSY